MTSNDVFIQSTPTTFDVATFDIWGALLNGARLVMVPDIIHDIHALANAYVEHQVTVAWLTAPIFSLMVHDYLPQMKSLRYCIAGGDVVSAKYVKQFVQAYPENLFINGYGPTENTTFSACQVVSANDVIGDSIPIGKPIGASTCYVLDNMMQAVGIGIPGELYVGGIGVAAYYQGQAGLTASHFVPDLFSAHGARLYRTGDLVMWNEQGGLEFLGRLDEQVKIRGFRIELDEVTHALENLPGVKHAIAHVHQQATHKRLVAYVAQDNADEAELLSQLRAQLPAYMVPTKLVLLPALPLTANGKVDRQQLPEINFDELDNHYQAPETAEQAQLCQWWSRVLQIPQVGIDDDFFALGGDSILAIQVLAQLKQEGKELGIRALFTHPTVRLLSAYISTHEDELKALVPAGDITEVQRLSDEVNQSIAQEDITLSQDASAIVARLSSSITPSSSAPVLPLTPLQQGMLHATAHAEHEHQYIIQTAFELSGVLDEARWYQCWQHIWQSHSLLRSCFVGLSSAHPVQQASEGLLMPWLQSDWRTKAPDYMQWLADERDDLSRLEGQNLMRFSLIRLGETEWRFVWSYHHALLDGWSKGLLLKQVFTDYEQGVNSYEFDQQTPFSDYTRWLHSRDTSGAMAWWEAHLSSFTTPNHLPQLKGHVDANHTNEKRRTMLSSDVLERLAAYSREKGVTASTVMQAVWGVLVGKLTAVEDVVYGLTVSGRGVGPAGIEQCIGPFINTVPVRIQWEANDNLTDVVTQLHETQLARQAHEYLGLPQIQKVSEVNTQIPLFESLFVFENYPFDQTLFDHDFNGIKLADVDGQNAIDYPLVMIVQPCEEGYELLLSYSTGHLSEVSASRLLAHYEQLLSSVLMSPETALNQTPWLSEQEWQSIEAWNANAMVVANESDTDVVSAFKVCVYREPDAVALKAGDNTYSFSELDQWSSSIAAHLQAQGYGEQDTIGVYQQADATMIASLLAILKIGAVYVPLDMNYPAERLNYMVNDAKLKAVLCDSHASGEFVPALPRVLVDEITNSADAAKAFVPAMITGQHPAYIIYTSGTTGKPKGTVTHHGGYANTASFHIAQCQINQSSRILQFASISFDSFMFEIFQMLMGGATLLLNASSNKLVGEQLVNFIEANQVTHLTLTASVISTICDFPLTSVRSILAGGEPCSMDIVKALAGKCQFVNAYGPSEASISVTSHEFEASDAIVSIGVPNPGLQIYIVDAYQQPIPFGVVGEIAIAGKGVGHGYINNPKLTAQTFIPNPFSQKGGRLYLSGDKGVIDELGQLLHLGRIDNQVKVNGVRIELVEIEVSVLSLPEVKAVHVCLDNTDQLACFVVWKSDALLSRQLFSAALSRTLPAHMIPKKLISVEQMPLTHNGKVDSAALIALMDISESTYDDFKPITTSAEILVAGVFEHVLKVEHVTSAKQDFFELGGNSIAAIEVMAEIKKVMGVDIRLSDFLLSSSIEELGQLVESSCKAVNSRENDTFTIDDDNQLAPFPLTEIQQAYWLGRFDQGDGALSTHGYFEYDFVDTDFTHEKFEQAFLSALNKHPMSRMKITSSGMQQFEPTQSSYRIPFYDFSRLNVDEQFDGISVIRDQMSHQTFDVHVFPLFEIRISQLTEDRFRLHFSMDAMLMDAASVSLFFSDVGISYDEDTALKPLDFSFRDYVLNLEQLKQSNTYEEHRDYWQSRVETIPSAPDLPVSTDVSSLNVFFRKKHTLEPLVWQQIQTLSNHFKLTPTVLLLSAYAEVIAAWSASDRFTLNLTLFNRYPLAPGVENLVGDFTSTNLTECHIDRQLTYIDRIKRLQNQLWQDLDHKMYSGVDVLRDLNRQLNGENRVAMPIVFTSAIGLNNAVSDTDVLEDYCVPPYSITQTSQAWIDCQVSEQNGHCHINWDVLDGAFEVDVVDNMFDCFVTLLNRLSSQAVLEEKAPVRLPKAQSHVRQIVNATDMPNSNELIHMGIETSAAKEPERIAITCAKEDVSFKQVEQYAKVLASKLITLGIKESEPVALIFDKGWQQHVAALGVLKAGGCYVPVDANLPIDRINAYITQSDIRFGVFASESDERRFEQQLTLDETILFDECSEYSSAMVQVKTVDKETPAYIIFTSGSTGIPKGVEIKHSAALGTILDINRKFNVGADDCAFSISAFNFDLSVYDLFGVMGCGGRVIVPQEDELKDPSAWLEAMIKNKVSIWNSVPALMQLLVDYLELNKLKLPTSLRLVMMSGDWIPIGLPARIKALTTDIEIISLGGATEASIWSIYYPIDPTVEFCRSIPYGKPLANQRFHILKPDFTECPDWVVGNVIIAGDGLATCYRNDKEKTNLAFVHHPKTGERLYKTGDLGRYLPDGNIEFLGRKDSQVKISGYRIELGEIEAQLNKHETIESSIVIVRDDIGNDRKIVAYVRFNKETINQDSLLNGQLAQFVGEFLSSYMVPLYFVGIDELPLTANGKINKKALPKIVLKQTERENHEECETTLLLCGQLASLLNISHVNGHDNFFELGGDSITAIQFIVKAKECGIALTPKDIFEQQTIEKMLAISTEQQTKLTEILEESLELSPIGNWLMQQTSPVIDHFNQTVVIASTEQWADVDVENAYIALCNQHPMLKSALKFDDDVNAFRYNIENTVNVSNVRHVDLSSSAEVDFWQAVKAISADSQDTFNINKSGLLKVIHFSGHDANGEFISALSLVAHHLIVDTISWQILLEDMQSLLEYADRDLPVSTTSYLAWNNNQHLQVSDYSDSELAYWTTQVDSPVLFPSALVSMKNELRHIETKQFSLDKETTNQLKTLLPKSFNSNMLQAILSSVLDAAHDQYQLESLTVRLEGQGRSTSEFDISRTVGWFTSIYPITIARVEGTTEKRLLQVKEQLNAVPQKGEHYGAIRYLHTDEAVRQQVNCSLAAITLNFLGDIGNSNQPIEGKKWWTPTLDISNQVHPAFEFDSQLSLSGFIVDGELSLSLMFSQYLFSTTEMSDFMDALKSALIQTAKYASNPLHWGYSASDFGLEKGLSSKINKLTEEISKDGFKPEIEDIYPATELQKGMQLVSQEQAGTGVYVIQTTLDVYDEFDLDIFKQTCDVLVNRHQILRTQICNVDSAHPWQVVYKQAEIPLQLIDWRAKDKKLLESLFESERFEDWVKGFESTDCPLTRITVYQLDERRFRLLWTAHHSIGDGWSQSIISSEMTMIYETLSNGKQPQLPTSVPFKPYIAWLETQESGRAEQYWQHELSGFTGANKVLPHDVNPLNTAMQSEIQFAFPHDKSESLRAICKVNKITLNSIIQALWVTLISRYTQDNEVSFGVTVAGRPTELADSQQMVGPFINTLPCRVSLAEKRTLMDLVEVLTTKQTQRSDFEHTTLRQIRKWIKLAPTQEFFESLIVFDNYPIATKTAGIEIFHNVSQNNYPLTLVVHPDDAVHFIVKYDGMKISKQNVEKLMNNFVSFVEKASLIDVIELSDLQLQRVAASSDRKAKKKARLLKFKQK